MSGAVFDIPAFTKWSNSIRGGLPGPLFPLCMRHVTNCKSKNLDIGVYHTMLMFEIGKIAPNLLGSYAENMHLFEIQGDPDKNFTKQCMDALVQKCPELAAGDCGVPSDDEVPLSEFKNLRPCMPNYGKHRRRLDNRKIVDLEDEDSNMTITVDEHETESESEACDEDFAMDAEGAIPSAGAGGDGARPRRKRRKAPKLTMHKRARKRIVDLEPEDVFNEDALREMARSNQCVLVKYWYESEENTTQRVGICRCLEYGTMDEDGHLYMPESQGGTITDAGDAEQREEYEEDFINDGDENDGAIPEKYQPRMRIEWLYFPEDAISNVSKRESYNFEEGHLVQPVQAHIQTIEVDVILCRVAVGICGHPIVARRLMKPGNIVYPRVGTLRHFMIRGQWDTKREEFVGVADEDLLEALSDNYSPEDNDSANRALRWWYSSRNFRATMGVTDSEESIAQTNLWGTQRASKFMGMLDEFDDFKEACTLFNQLKSGGNATYPSFWAEMDMCKIQIIQGKHGEGARPQFGWNPVDAIEAREHMCWMCHRMKPAAYVFKETKDQKSNTLNINGKVVRRAFMGRQCGDRTNAAACLLNSLIRLCQARSVDKTRDKVRACQNVRRAIDYAMEVIDASYSEEGNIRRG